MAARIGGGLAGWLAGILPLLVVDALEYFGVYYFAQPALAGAVALAGGILLGGITAGAIGGRASRRRAGGATGAAVSGGLAAIFYAITLIAVLYVARAQDAPPAVIARHPIRFSAAILFFAVLLMGAAVLMGAISGRRQTGREYDSASYAPPVRPDSMPMRGSQSPYEEPAWPRQVGYTDDRREYWSSPSGSMRQADRPVSQPRAARDMNGSRDSWRS